MLLNTLHAPNICPAPFGCCLLLPDPLLRLCRQIPSDPKLIMASYEPDRLSKFFLTTVEQQPRRELLLPSDVGVPIRCAASP
jgi:hypothetical protein